MLKKNDPLTTDYKFILKNYKNKYLKYIIEEVLFANFVTVLSDSYWSHKIHLLDSPFHGRYREYIVHDSL